MKKIRTLVIMLLLIAALALPASAAAGKATVTTQNVTVKPGETFTLTVALQDADKINIGTMVLSYDTAALELLGGKCLVEDAAVGQVVQDKNAGTFLLMTAREVTGDIFEFEMKARDNASADDYRVELIASVGNGSGAYIETAGTVVTVTEKNASVVPETTVGVETDPQQTIEMTVGVETDPQQTGTADGTEPAKQQTTDTIGETEDVPVKSPESLTEQDDDGEKPEGGFPWWILAVVLAAAAAAAVVAVKRSKK